jgi:hypothetical protein
LNDAGAVAFDDYLLNARQPSATFSGQILGRNVIQFGFVVFDFDLNMFNDTSLPLSPDFVREVDLAEVVLFLSGELTQTVELFQLTRVARVVSHAPTLLLRDGGARRAPAPPRGARPGGGPDVRARWAGRGAGPAPASGFPGRLEDPGNVGYALTAVGKAARIFGVPTLLTAAFAERQELIKELKDVFPEQHPIDRTTLNSWEDPRVISWLDKTGRRTLVVAGLWTEEGTR